jgi:SulP family sulfate permease
VSSILTQIAPFIPWLRSYRGHHLRADLVAALTVAVVAVPQSMAYALIAGVPVQYGLYASILPAIAAGLWGSSAHLITGPTTAVSLVVFTTLSQLDPAGPGHYLEMVFALAVIVGALQILMGTARLGVFLNFVSHSVILGFSTGAAVLIGLKQLPGFLGLAPSQSGAFAVSTARLAAAIQAIHPITLTLGLITVAVILVVRKLKPRWPGTLIAMVLVSGIVAAFDLDRHGVAVVGAIPRALPPFHFPAEALSQGAVRMLPGALAIAVLGLVEAVSIAKAIAGQTHQRLNINQEFIGQGLANLAAGCFSGYPGSGSFTRSAVNFRSGARTPMSGILSGAAVGAVVLLAAPLAASLPVAALAGVLLVVAVEMIRVADIRRTMRATRNDGVVLIITFLSTLLLSIEFAVYVGVLLSIGLHLAATSHPRIFSTIPDPETGKMVGSAFGRMCCQLDILRIEGSVFFGSAAYVQEDLLRRLNSHPHMGCLLIRMHQVNNFDASGVHVLELVLAELVRRGGGLYLSGVNTRVFQVFKNSGLAPAIGEGHFRSTTGSAIRQAMRDSFCPFVCAACEYAVFRECAELKKGNWEVLGKSSSPRCPLKPPGTPAPDSSANEGNAK